jgi:predicted acyltransferase (DUF342 family)
MAPSRLKTVASTPQSRGTVFQSRRVGIRGNNRTMVVNACRLHKALEQRVLRRTIWKDKVFSRLAALALSISSSALKQP